MKVTIFQMNQRIVCMGILVFGLIGGCTTKCQVKPYTFDSAISDELQEGLVFSLPKTIVEAKITYSLYRKTEWKEGPDGKPIKKDENGKLLEPEGQPKLVIVVDKPIEITTHVLPDPDMTFIFDLDSLDAFAKSTDITLELTDNGMLKSTNVIVEDKSKEIIANLGGTVLNAAKLATVSGVKVNVVELTLMQDVKVCRMIDPSAMDMTTKPSDQKSVFVYKYDDSEKSNGLFSEPRIKPPKVIITLTSSVDLLTSPTSSDLCIKDKNKLVSTFNGIPYRVGGNVRITASIGGREAYDRYHLFAQAGGVSIIPLKSKAFVDITQGLTFSESNSALVKYESKGSSQGEAISAMLKETTGTALTGVKDIQQVELDQLKKEKEIYDAKLALEESKKKWKEANR